MPRSFFATGLVRFNVALITFRLTVTNKEICLVRIVFIFLQSAVSLFARQLIEKKILFSSQVDCCSTPLLRHNRYYDRLKFQIDLEILASLKNFDN